MLIDFIFLILMVFAIFKGYSRGLIVALFSVFAFIAGIAAAMKLSMLVANYMDVKLGIGQQWLPALSFIVVFIGVALLVRLGAALIQKTVQLAMLGWMNRLLGIILYAVLYIVILSVIVFYAAQVSIVGSETLHDSRTWPFLEPWGPWAMNGLGKLIPIFKNMFQQLQDFFQGVSERAA